MECEKKNIKSKYYGETNFNGYTRGVQHQNKYRSKSKKTQEKSALRKHAKEVHDDKKVDYRMEVLKSFKNNPLARQVYESVKIVNSKIEDDIQLNDKDEFNQAMIITAKYGLDILDVLTKTPGLYQVPKLRNLNFCFCTVCFQGGVIVMRSMTLTSLMSSLKPQVSIKSQS